ncbi:MAG: AAA family ATPase [Ignavibacteriales bacterium]|nr:AAA family ATPase [Ignavibacteriales bacterium]
MFESLPQYDLESRLIVSLIQGGDAAIKNIPINFRATVFICNSFQEIFRIIELLQKDHLQVNFKEIAKKGNQKLSDEIEDIMKQIPTDLNFADDEINQVGRELIRRAENSSASTIDSKIEIVPNSDIVIMRGSKLLSMNIKKADDLIEGILRSKSLNFIAGEENSGKSMLAMNLAIDVSIGAPTFLSWDLKIHGKVIYINNEMYIEDFASRFKVMNSQLQRGGNVDNFIFLNVSTSLFDVWEELIQICEKEKPCLIILDCLYFAHNQDENDSSKMKALIRKLQSLRDRYNLCVLILHHTKKGARNDRLHNDLMRGAGVFGAAADTVIMMKRSQTEEGKRILKPTKLRHSSDVNREARLLSLNSETLWFRDEGVANEADHLQNSNQITAAETIDFTEIFEGKDELKLKEIVAICEPDGFDKRTIQRLLDAAVRNGKLYKLRHGVYSLNKPSDVDNPIKP